MPEITPARPRFPSFGGGFGAYSARSRQWTGAAVRDPIVILVLVAVGLLAHGLNMFNYPAFTLTDDEGILAAHAWAVLREQQLSPYTYVYDNPPAGPLLVAGWALITGGLDSFGGAIDSGRVLMLVLHLAMIALLYHLVRKLGGGVMVAALAAFIFSVSPLAIFYQRLLLLDTIMLFWLLLSLNLLLDGWGRLSRLVLSGACYGIALLTRETAILFLPAMLFLAVQQRWRHQGQFAVAGWLVPAAVVLSWYPLYAVFKGELLPNEPVSFIADEGYAAGGVSLAQALWWQMARGGGGPFNLDNQFWTLLRGDWLPRDPILLLGGAAAVALNIVRGVGWGRVRDRRALAAALLGLLPLLYLARGGRVLTSEIVLAIPFLALNLAIFIGPLLRRVPAIATPVLAPGLAVLLAVGYWTTGALPPLFQARPDEAGREALAWIERHLPAESRVITRDDLWTDLRERSGGRQSFINAHSHWKVAGDPEVRTGVFGDDWRTVDYLIMQPDLGQEFAASGNTVALNALQNAHLVKRWEAASGDAGLHPRQIVELWKVDRPGSTEASLLAGSDRYMKSRFERDGAYVAEDGTVTSEAQSYAMLRAVWSDDRSAFYAAWGWTRAHLLRPDGLLAWQWRDGGVVDTNSAADADTDTALALLFAGRRWDDPALTEAGRQLVQAIWRHEVTIVRGRPYLTAGTWAAEGQVIALNPSYFAPYAYRIFQEVDPAHDWLGVIATGYEVLFRVAEAPFGRSESAGLPANWVGLDRNDGAFIPLWLDGQDRTRYGYDAARTYWRVALDLRWNDDGRARRYLELAGFLRDEVARKGYVSAVYEHDGAVVEDTPSAVSTAGAVAALLTLDPDAAHALHAAQTVGESGRTAAGVTWGNPNDIYAQAWGWFGTAFYADVLPNLWSEG
jgi:endo-1,4-beta-D-glucanase Y/4-amino-4-deoxy-L-arabinose transferase-like glycosyltransferase